MGRESNDLNQDMIITTTKVHFKEVSTKIK